MPEVSAFDERQMSALTASLPDNKSEKIRRLAAAGFKRADIARFLGVRYQFVYNVLSAAEERARQEPRGSVQEVHSTTEVAPREPQARSSERSSKWQWTEVGKGGRIDLPSAFLQALGVNEGDSVQLALEGEVVRVLSRAAALRELQEDIRRYVPDVVSLVDELIAERRAEAAREERGDGNG